MVGRTPWSGADVPVGFYGWPNIPDRANEPARGAAGNQRITLPTWDPPSDRIISVAVANCYRGLARIVFFCLMGLGLNGQNPNSDKSRHKVSFVTVGEDVRLEVLDWGGYGRPLVLLAGLGGTAHVFDDFAPKLTDHGRVVGITRRGFGASSAPQSGYSVGRFAQDVLESLDALDLKEAVLIGHSFGGEELTRAAGAQYGRIAGLVYLDAAIDQSGIRTMSSSQLDGMRRSMQMTDSVWQEILSSMAKPDYKNIQIPAIALFAIPRSATDSIETSIEVMKSNPGLGGSSASGREALDAYELLDAYRNNDPAARRNLDQSFSAYRRDVEHNIQLFRTGMAHGRVVEVVGASHLIYLSNPADVLREVAGFTRDLR